MANENKKDEPPLIDEKVGIKKEEKKKQASISIKKEKAIQDELKDLGDDIQKAEEIIEDKNEKEREQGIMISIGKILKDLESTTGGLITLFALQYYLNQGDFPNLKKFELLGVIDTLKENQVILDEISFSGVNIYLYEDLVFDEEMKKLLRNFVTHGEMDMEDIEAATDWDDEKTKRVLKRFYDQKILKMNEKKLFFIPGLFNTK